MRHKALAPKLKTLSVLLVLVRPRRDLLLEVPNEPRPLISRFLSAVGK